MMNAQELLFTADALDVEGFAEAADKRRRIAETLIQKDPKYFGAPIRQRTWRDKAHEVIHAACKQSYLQMNTNKAGKLYKKPRPYAVPEVAEKLIGCLNRDDEHGAKALFLFDYDVLKIQKLPN
jgi:hypothetical protein